MEVLRGTTFSASIGLCGIEMRELVHAHALVKGPQSDCVELKYDAAHNVKLQAY